MLDLKKSYIYIYIYIYIHIFFMYFLFRFLKWRPSSIIIFFLSGSWWWRNYPIQIQALLVILLVVFSGWLLLWVFVYIFFQYYIVSSYIYLKKQLNDNHYSVVILSVCVCVWSHRRPDKIIGQTEYYIFDNSIDIKEGKTLYSKLVNVVWKIV